MKNSNRGFTLIELLVVIAIIGILSSVVLASLNSAREKSRDAKRVSDIKQLQLALELYYDTNQEYPDVLTSLASTYIANVPTDNSVPYLYDNLTSAGAACSAASGVCSTYHLAANLEQETTHAAFQGDADWNNTPVDSITEEDGTGCTSSAAGYGCYDVRN
ncbi:MAG: prepilin-type N-terminal cleavage/methylation domain-containing protein [Candidatus Yonathbacteria bacterium]|nr:prepilin-type N-terminal cleavage/methylation domain-containing protein [Candidatus Yonathbacteria bacterium]NTW47457.1 prepilin-type N-terminal cleavage/methylation domain-containing protein [Candidatus Yonathbacteria bacterium]